MRGFKSIVSVAALALFGVAGTANATLVLEFDSIIAGYTPNTGSAPWLTATITNNGDGVDISLSTNIEYPPEFITDVFFSVGGASWTGGNCTKGSNPAGTGPWQVCIAFAPNTHWDGPTFGTFVDNVQESNFQANASGWFATAHIQGIQPECSGWIGANDSGTGTSRVDNGSGVCGAVPEPGTLGLLGFGLAGLGFGFRRRKI